MALPSTVAGYRHLTQRDLQKCRPDVKASINAAIHHQSTTDYADKQSQRHRQQSEEALSGKVNTALSSVIPEGLSQNSSKAMHWLISLGVAAVGAIICSASVQTVLITLPPFIRWIATPLIAATLVLLGENVGRSIITTLHLKQEKRLEQKRLEHRLSRTNREFPFEVLWQQAQLDLLETVEARPWPLISLGFLGLTLLVEAGAALFLAIQESIMIGIFAALLPLLYVGLVSLLLSKLIDMPQEHRRLAHKYELYMVQDEDVINGLRNDSTTEEAQATVTSPPKESAAVELSFELEGAPEGPESNGRVEVPNVLFPNS